MPDTDAKVQTKDILRELIDSYCHVKQMCLQLLDDAKDEKTVDSLCQSVSYCDLVIVKLQHLQFLIEHGFAMENQRMKSNSRIANIG